ncbi:dihydroorotate dehydrogenase [Spirochaetota bacterium]
MKSDHSISFAGISFKNPIVTASGTFGYGYEFSDYFDINMLGGITLKGLTVNKKPGNPSPRLCETEHGVLNAIGLQNEGIEYFVKNIYPQIRDYRTNIIANISGESVNEYLTLINRLSVLDKITMIEINISCPNVEKGGLQFGADPAVVAKLVKKCSKVKKQPIIVKLSPNVSDIGLIAKTCEDSGADGISLINTLIGMKIDINCRKALLHRKTGGYSGPAVKPVAVRMVYEARKACSIPIIGMGGIMNSHDVIEFIMAGATLVGIGTLNLTDPLGAKKILESYIDYMNTHKLKIKNIIGCID